MNEKADRIARKAIKDVIEHNVILPRSDFKCHIKYKVIHKWKERWNNITENKYRDITNSIHPLGNSTSPIRSWSIILTRLRIGHCTLTHGHLMNNTYQPYCDDCIVPLTVKHFLTECPSYREERIQCFGTDTLSMKDILGGRECQHGGSLFSFLLTCNIIDKI